MKNIKRILTATLAMVMVLSVMLTGCKFNKIPGVAATYGDGKELTTGQYLAYLYLEFENLYFNQGLYQYASYGMDPWTQTFPYGENDEKLVLSDYIIRATQDNIKRQIVLEQILKANNLSWNAEDLAEIEKNLAEMEKDAYLPLGFNNDSYAYALKNANLNERSAFYGLYGKGGPRAIAEEDLKKYFADNYLSYKSISIALTDKDGKALDEKGEEYKKIQERMEKYLKICEEKGFDEAKKQYDADEKAAKEEANKKEEDKKDETTEDKDEADKKDESTEDKDEADKKDESTEDKDDADKKDESTEDKDDADKKDETTEETDEHAGHDHGEEEEDPDPNRVDVDGNTDAIDDNLVKAMKDEEKGVKVGETKILTYKANGTTPTMILVERLDINKDRHGKEGGLYEDQKENIIYELKYEEFDAEVKAEIAKLKITFDKKVVDKCLPKDFLTIMENL